MLLTLEMCLAVIICVKKERLFFVVVGGDERQYFTDSWFSECLLLLSFTPKLTC